MAPRTLSRRWLPIIAVALLTTSTGPTVQAHATDLPTQSGGHGDGTDDSGFWNLVTGFSTKTGFRMVFAWDSDKPIVPLVEWGYSPDQLDQVARPVGDVADSAGVVFLDSFELPNGNKTTVYFRFVDDSGGLSSGGVAPDPSPVQSFVQGNAMYSDTHDGIYEANVVVALDSEALPDDVPADLGLADLTDGIDLFAERVWDMTDGHLRIGSVLIMDRMTGYPTGPVDAAGGAAGIVQNGGEPITCGTPGTKAEGMQIDHTFPDFIIETAPSFDSHTSKHDALGPMITSSCYGFYVGREGWLYANPWTPEDLGAVFAHEFGHYALNLDDLYPTGLPGDKKATCWDGTGGTPGTGSNWDVSVMHNGFRWDGTRWIGSELDSVQTPCSAMGTATPSWSLFSKWYPKVPLMRNGDGKPDHFDSNYQLLQGNPDGGALDVYVLDREPGLSKLQHVLSPPILPPPPESNPTITIEEPTEGQGFHVDRIQISGTVDRGYPDLPLTVDAHGPYTVKIGEEVILIGTAANGVGPYEYRWTTTGPGTFADPKTGITKAVFSSEGSFEVKVQAWDRGNNDPFKPTSTATDTATVKVLPPEPEGTAEGCPPMDGQILRRQSNLQPATDSGNDAKTVAFYGTARASELLCLGASLQNFDVVTVPGVASSNRPAHMFTFQLQVQDKTDVFTQARLGSTTGIKTQSYLISFTPNFGTDLNKDVPQWIFVKWDRTPSALPPGAPVDRLTACWLLFPPGPPVAEAPELQTYDYDDWDCDPSRSVSATWTLNTLLVTFDLEREIGQASDGKKFENVHAWSNFRQSGLTYASNPGLYWIEDTLDTVPDSEDGFVRFAGPDSLQAPPVSPPKVALPEPNPQGFTVEPQFGSSGNPEVVDPPGDTTYPAYDILGMWVQDDLVDLPIPDDTFTLVMRVRDLDTTPPPSSTEGNAGPAGGFFIGAQTSWKFNFCIDSSKTCYQIDTYNDLAKGRYSTTGVRFGGGSHCFSPTPEPVIFTKFILDTDEIHVRVRADSLDAISASGIAGCSINEGGKYPTCGSRLYGFYGSIDTTLWAGKVGIPIAANAVNQGVTVLGPVYDSTGFGKDYTFCPPAFEVDAGPMLIATQGKATPMGGTVTGGTPAFLCTWSAPGATFTPDPGDPTGCFLVTGTFSICGEIPVKMSGQDSFAPPHHDQDMTTVLVTGEQCDGGGSQEYVEILARPIQPSGAAAVAPLSLAKVPVETTPDAPRGSWSYEWSGLTEEYDGYWMITAKWFDKPLQVLPLANATVNITIGLARISKTLEDGFSNEDNPSSSPGTEDRDLDGFTDEIDNCPATPNSQQADLDEDGLGDACDEDADGDGWKNFLDNCAMKFDPSLHDADQDRKGDACDDDDDNDGIKDAKDNCFLDKNADQADLDADGLGDVCDDDRDGDGAPDVLDHFPDSPAEWIDFDHDRLGDNADGDDDNDGLTDELEDAYGTHNAARLQAAGRDGASLDSTKESPGFGGPAAFLAVAVAALAMARLRRR